MNLILKTQKRFSGLIELFLSQFHLKKDIKFNTHLRPRAHLRKFLFYFSFILWPSMCVSSMFHNAFKFFYTVFRFAISIGIISKHCRFIYCLWTMRSSLTILHCMTIYTAFNRRGQTSTGGLPICLNGVYLTSLIYI